MALATALLADPPLLVLDELTSNLDAQAQHSFMSLLLRLKARGKTIFFTSHHWEELEKLADRVLILENGHLRGEHRPHRAESEGESRLMHVHVAEEMLDGALDVLRAKGITVSRNGSGLHVQTPAGSKVAPIEALLRADIPVRDFDLTAPARNGSCFGGNDDD
jgi:ABC-type multidrug transport system ATPase subunit